MPWAVIGNNDDMSQVVYPQIACVNYECCFSHLSVKLWLNGASDKRRCICFRCVHYRNITVDDYFLPQKQVHFRLPFAKHMWYIQNNILMGCFLQHDLPKKRNE